MAVQSRVVAHHRHVVEDAQNRVVVHHRHVVKLLRRLPLRALQAVVVEGAAVERRVAAPRPDPARPVMDVVLVVAVDAVAVAEVKDMDVLPAVLAVDVVVVGAATVADVVVAVVVR